MAGGKSVWGIDVGQCAIKALKLQLVGDGVEALAFDIVEHPKPLNAGGSGEELSDLLTQAVATLMSRNDMAGDSVVIGVPGYQAFMRFTKLPPVEKKQLPAIIQFEAGQQIPYDIDQVIWDYQIFSEEDSPDVEVGIFCMRNEQLDRYLTPFTDAGLQPIIVQPAPLALHNYLVHDMPRPGKATILLDVGAESTDLIVSDRGNVWTRAIPIGGNNFTDRLVEAFRLEFAKAESLKRSASTSKYARQVFQAMRPVYQDLVAEILRSIGRYTQTHRDAVIDLMVGMGNGFRLPGLQKFLNQNLDMKVERVQAFNNLAAGPGLNAPTLIENVLSLGVAYGLAVQGLGRSPVNSNLLPPQIAKRGVWRRKRPFFAATAACLVLSAACLWARSLLDNSALARATGGKEISVRQLKDKQADAAVRRPASSVPPRQYVADILGAANGYSSEWTTIHREVDEGKDRVDQMMAMVADQALWPKIVDLVDRALPRKDEKLVAAASLDDYLAVAKAIGDRNKRRQIFIESLDSRYSPNVAADPVIAPPDLTEPTDGRGRTPGRSPAPARRPPPRTQTPGAKRAARGGPADRADGRGFVVTLKGYTPYQYDSILKEFRETLKTLGNPKDPNVAEDLGFYVLMPETPFRPQMRNKARADELEDLAKRGGQPPAGTEEEIRENDPDRDPVTGEIWVRDLVFTLSFGVVLGPTPEASDESKDSKTSARTKAPAGKR